MNFGIICEFNPFHDGHQYLIDSIKQDGDGIICAMSGNFVQRGDAAVYSKFERAEEAVRRGADLVIELVTPCAVQSAQGFAAAGIRLLESTGICDALTFGAECADIDALRAVANEMNEKDEDIRAALTKGISYPAAVRSAVDSPLLDSPNNVLAIEYLAQTRMDARAVKRIGGGHDSDDAQFSASAIRKNLKDKATLQNCEAAVLYRLRQMTAEGFALLDDVSEGLEHRLAEAVRTATTLDELYTAVKTKRYTLARIRRIILRAWLQIDKQTDREPRYIRVLAMNEKGAALLSEMADKATLPVITRYKDACACGGAVLAQYLNECRYTDWHALCFSPALPCGGDAEHRLRIQK